MEIYNRWGELIFVSNALEYRWDGYYKGDLCQQDVYVFKIRYKARNFVSKAIYGRVLLLN
jgi:gliding motility-associated-like protein